MKVTTIIGSIIFLAFIGWVISFGCKTPPRYHLFTHVEYPHGGEDGIVVTDTIWQKH